MYLISALASNQWQMPAAILASLVGLTMVVVGMRKLLHDRAKRIVGEKLKAYKAQVVQLSDALDALQERHKLLPFTDADFSEPMTGETLALYNSVQAAVGRYRENWLKLMDAWDRAQAMYDTETSFGTSKCREARRIIEAAGAPDQLKAIQQECAAPLDRLEQAHEQATERLAVVKGERGRLDPQLARVQGEKFSTEPYQAELQAVADLTQRAESVVRTDPIGAQSALAQAGQKVAGLGKRLERVLQLSKRAQQEQGRLQEATALATRQRAAGFLLTEPEANPDPLLATGRNELQATGETLNRGDVEAAERHVEQAASFVTKTVQAIEAHVKAKATCETEIPARRADTARLLGVISQTHGQQQELDRNFAADSWGGVAGNLNQARSLVGQCDTQVGEAATAAGPSVQHYGRAARLLDQTQKQQQQAGVLLAAVGQRLRELTDLRTKCHTQLGEVRGRAIRVAELLRTNTADRPRSNQRYQTAVQVLDQVARDATGPRPDWTKVAVQLEDARAGLEKAEQLAREDIQLSQQAAAEIAETEGEIRRAKSFYRLGISADVSTAESQLARARLSLQSQAYEEVIQLANAAEQTAKAAYDSAVRQADQKQRELDEAQRRREQEEAAARQAAAAAAAAAAQATMAGVHVPAPTILNAEAEGVYVAPPAPAVAMPSPSSVDRS